MTDIVKRLRKGDPCGDCKRDRCACVIMEEAADEITRLTAEVEKLRALAAKADEAIARQQQDLEEATDRAADCDTLRAEVEKLRAALLDIRNMGPMTVDDQRWRIARAALEEK